MAKKIKNIIIHMFLLLGTVLILLGGSALDSEDIVLPIKVCLVGIALLFISVLMLNSNKRYSGISEADENPLE